VASQVGRLHLTKIRLFGCTRRKLKKARKDQSGKGGLQQLGHMVLCKPEEFEIRMAKQPRSQNSTLDKEAKHVMRPRDLMGQGTYSKALTNN
jgi:hypothetical protein